VPQRIIQNRYSTRRTNAPFNRPQRLRPTTQNHHFTIPRQHPPPIPEPLETQLPDFMSDIVNWESDSDITTSDEESSTNLQQESFLYSNLDGVDVRDEVESENEYDDEEAYNQDVTGRVDNTKGPTDQRFVEILLISTPNLIA